MLKSFEDVKEISDKRSPYIVEKLISTSSSALLVGDSKSGKSSMVLQLVIAALSNEPFLDITEYNIDYVVILSNDSNENSIMQKINRIGFDERVCNKLYFNFEKTLTIEKFETAISSLLVEKDSYILVVIDVLAGLQIEVNGKFQIDLNNYQSVHMLIDAAEEVLFRYYKNASILYVHHLNKRGSCLGSIAIKSRVSCYMTLTSTQVLEKVYGKLTIESNDGYSRVIPLFRNDEQYHWIIDEAGLYEENYSMDINIIRINDALVRKKDHIIEGDVNSIISQCHLTLTPRRLSGWLEENKRILRENNIYISKRKSNTTIFTFRLQGEE